MAATDTARTGGGVFRHRDFALLWSGQSISVAGNGIFLVALPLEVLRLTSSSLDLALVVSLRTIPALIFLLIGGALADRLPRRAVMLAADSVSGLAVCAAAVLIALRAMQIWELMVLSLIMGLASAFFVPAATAIVRDVLPAELLVNGSSVTSLSQSLGQYLGGPLAGGLIVSTAGTAWAFGMDGISFLVSAACLAAMRRVTTRAERHPPILAALRDGLRYSRSQPWLWWSMIALGLANLLSFVPLFVLEALLLRKAFGAGALALGAIYAASGAGGSAASLIVRIVGAPRQRVAAMWVAWAAAGLGILLLGLSPQIWVAVVVAGLAWGAITYGNVLWVPLIQKEVPPAMLGRVSSLDWLITFSLSPLGTVMGGALAALIGIRLTLILGGAATMLTGGVVLVPGVRNPDRRQASTADKVSARGY